MAGVESLNSLDPASAWEPWTPGRTDPWNRKWAGHLFRRAAFGASWPEIENAVTVGVEATVDQLLKGGEGQAEFNQIMDELAPETATNEDSPRPDRLQGWWLARMINTPFPLLERMTLFWHNHFATSIAKVRHPYLMKQQNVLLRKNALGKFGPFLLEMSKDPAMLLWLDSNSNVRGKPNENYARELMELFTLGVSNYTENDIREAARAFTGWHTNRDASRQFYGPAKSIKFVFRAYLHDDGVKTILGQTGKWDGQDVVRMVLDRPAAARFLAGKLFRHFVSETESPPARLLEPLATQLRKSEYDSAQAIRTILRSKLFFSEHAYRQRIKSPIEFLVGILRSLEGKTEVEWAQQNLPAPLDGLGQNLFVPPSVKGWEGGKAWLNSATVLARHNLAWKVLDREGEPYPCRVNPVALVDKYGAGKEPGDQVTFLLRLLLQPGEQEIDIRAREKLSEFLARGRPQGEPLDRRVRETTHAVLLMPEYQLA
jgi:uncharacterized protein (DUF1800 family)